MTQQQLKWICADQIFDGLALHNDLCIGVFNGKVLDLKARQDLGDIAIQEIEGLLSPGFVDLQVNGGGGVLFNADPSPRGIAAMETAHRSLGTARILPTVITDAPDVLDKAADAVIGKPQSFGIHIEGPHISQARRGTHAAKHIRPFDARTFDVIAKVRAKEIPVLLTIAPEAITPAQVAQLAEMGVVVSIGHTDTTATAARDTLQAGARCFTHLYNAMSPMLNRAPGVVGAAINSDAYAGIICDGIHVADEMVQLAIRARTLPDRMFAVSDAMPTVGGADRFDLYGQTIRLDDGQLINAEGGLAGAHFTMLESYRRLTSVLDIPQEQALRMCHTVPMDVLLGTQRKRNTLLGASLSDVIVIRDTDFAWADSLG